MNNDSVSQKAKTVLLLILIMMITVSCSKVSMNTSTGEPVSPIPAFILGEDELSPGVNASATPEMHSFVSAAFPGSSLHFYSYFVLTGVEDQKLSNPRLLLNGVDKTDLLYTKEILKSGQYTVVHTFDLEHKVTVSNGDILTITATGDTGQIFRVDALCRDVPLGPQVEIPMIVCEPKQTEDPS